MPERTVEKSIFRPEKSSLLTREEIFEQIANLKDLPRRLKFTAGIMEHSVEDGIALADRLGLRAGDLSAIVANPRFAIKHPDVLKQLVRKVMTSGTPLKEIKANQDQNKALELLIEQDDILHNADKFDNLDILGDKISESKGGENVAGEDNDKLLKKINDYYAPLLQTRKFSPREIRGNYPRGEEARGLKAGETRELKSVERLADEALMQEELLLLPAYYARTAKEIISKHLLERGLPGQPKWLSDDFFVTKETIEKECQRLGISFEDIEPRLEAGARYSSVTAGFKNSEAQRGILKKLNKSLEGKEQKAELKDDKYQIVEDKETKKIENKDFDFAKFESKALDYIDQLLNGGANKGLVAIGLAGLDSDRAWQMREKLLKDDANKGYVAIGLAGLDSDRAWQMRERLLKANADKGFVAQGLAGLDSDRAWQMRERLLKANANKGFVAMGLAGDYTTFVWQLKINKNESLSDELTVEERKQLDLLNLLRHPDLESIDKHFHAGLSLEEKKKKSRQEAKNILGGSRFFSEILAKLIKEQPKIFLPTMAAKRDRKLAPIFAEQLAVRIFPEINRAREKAAWRGFSGYAGLESGRRIMPPDPQDYLNPISGFELTGGGAEGMADDREIMELRDFTGGIIATNIFGKGNSETGHWQTVDFPRDAPLTEPILETTATLPNVNKLTQVSLPKPIEAQVIPERVKGFDAGGKEYDLKIQVNRLGEAKVVDKPKEVERIAYSLAVAAAPEPMKDLSGPDYLRFKQKFEQANGGDLSAELAGLPEDLELMLLSAIKDKKPKEQIMAIERLVRDLGYYDKNNQEVSGLKRGKPLEEQMYVMQQRVEELRRNKPELADELKNKKFAGVCADFAQLTAVLLRRAGFASGLINGFAGVNRKVAVKNAHATAFALWPDESGKNRVISIDGTPDGVAGVSLPSLAEREVEAVEQEKKFADVASKEIQQIIEGLNKLDSETVRRMSNGELERVLNSILKYQVKESHLDIIERLFDYYWYTPIHTLDLANPGQRGEAMLELAGAVERQRRRLAARPKKNETPAGNKLMQTMQDFLGRFAVAGATEDKYAALELMEKITELVQNDLSEVEKKAAFAVIAYLKAKNILGDKK